MTEALSTVDDPAPFFVVHKLNGQQLECAVPRHCGALVADLITNLTLADPGWFNLIGTCFGDACRLTPQDTSLDCIDFTFPLTLVPKLVGAAPKKRLAFAHPTASSSSPGPSSKPLSAFFTRTTPAQAPATPRLTWVHEATQTAQSTRVGAPLLHDVRGKVTLKGQGARSTTPCPIIDRG